MTYKKLLIIPAALIVALSAGNVSADGKTYTLPPACNTKFSTVEKSHRSEARALYGRLKAQYRSTLHERYEASYVKLKQNRDTVRDAGNRKGLYATTDAKYQMLLNSVDDSLSIYDENLTATQSITSDLVNAETNRLQMLCSPSYSGYQQGLTDTANTLQAARNTSRLYDSVLPADRKDAQKKLTAFKKYITQYKVKK